MTESIIPETERQPWLDRLKQILLREPKNREELIQLLRDAERRYNLLNVDALAMVEGVLQISEMQVRDIMIPRSQTIVVQADQALKALLPIIIESKHSRFPVVNSDREEVIGVLHAKDLLAYSMSNEKFEIRDVMRPALFVPESKRLDTLLKEFRIQQNHMAIVVDEYGTIAGCITIEDILEQIVGEIADEFDVDEETFIKQFSSDEYIVKALMPIDEFNDYFKEQFDTEEMDTIGGLILKTLGHMPHQGEVITIDKFNFEILRTDKRRIHLLRVKLNEKVTSLEEKK